MKKKKILMVLLSLILSVTTLTACGNETSSEKEPTTLSDQVNATCMVGVGSTVLQNIKGDYKVSSYNDLDKVTANITSGKSDVAVLPTSTAAKLYGKTKGNIVEISPASLGGVYILSNGYYIEDPKISSLSGKTIVICGHDTTAEYVLDNLMTAAGISTETGVTVKYVRTYAALEKALTTYGTVALATQPYAKRILKNNSSVIKFMDLNEKWKETENEEIITDVVVASKDFAEKHSDDLKVFINNYETALENTEKSSCDFVFYGASNRGITLLKKFNDTMYNYNSSTFGNKKPKQSMYYQK